MPTEGVGRRSLPPSSHKKLRVVVTLVLGSFLIALYVLWQFSSSWSQRSLSGKVASRLGFSSVQNADNVEPILGSRPYPMRSAENVVWQQEEVFKYYPNATDFQLHGTLYSGQDLDARDFGKSRSAFSEFYEIIKWRKPLKRNITDWRPNGCKKYTDLSKEGCASVIFIFSNENLELLLRSIYSVLDRTPPTLLREILLIDDASTRPEMLPKNAKGMGLLQHFVERLPKTRYILLERREGIVGARMRGIREARSDVIIILDSHIEVGHHWIEPLLVRIREDTRRIVMPFIDGISSDYEVQHGGIGCVLGILWKLVEHAYPPDDRNPERYKIKPTDFVTSPVMAGGLFAAHRKFFLDLGGYDEGMEMWGAENLELSFRLWQCGGILECTECSRVHHLFGSPRGYSKAYTGVLKNKLRTAGAWMDEFGDLSWRMLGQPDLSEPFQGLEKRLQLRQALQCHNFKWFLDHVWPESDIRELPRDVPYLGNLQSNHTKRCLLGGVAGDCTVKEAQLMYFKQSQQIHPVRDDETCLASAEQNSRPTWQPCTSAVNQKWRFDPLKGFLMSQMERNIESLCVTSIGQLVSGLRGIAPAKTEVVMARCNSAWPNQVFQPLKI